MRRFSDGLPSVVPIHMAVVSHGCGLTVVSMRGALLEEFVILEKVGHIWLHPQPHLGPAQEQQVGQGASKEPEGCAEGALRGVNRTGRQPLT